MREKKKKKKKPKKETSAIKSFINTEQKREIIEALNEKLHTTTQQKDIN